MRSRLPGILFLLALALAGIAGWFVLPHKVAPVETLRADAALRLPICRAGTRAIRARALAAFRRSCAAINPSRPARSSGGYAGQVSGLARVVHRAPTSRRERRARISSNSTSTPSQVAGDALVHRLLRAVAAWQPHAARRLSDAGLWRCRRSRQRRSRSRSVPRWKGEHIAGRVDGQHLVPYRDARRDRCEAARREGDLFYGDDPVAVFFLHIQGSGRVVLDDGATIRVAYAGQNGQPYTAIGRTLIR